MPESHTRTRFIHPAGPPGAFTHGRNGSASLPRRTNKVMTPARQTTAAALFAGVGGIELGLSRAGFKTEFFCESLPEARRVLAGRFPGVPIRQDIRQLVAAQSFRLPDVELVSAGFPCQDLSQCGLTAGIRGKQSGLVACLFSLLKRRRALPRWLLIENVPFMLRLDGGKAMSHMTASLEDMGFRWAYRVVDARAFGLPQRRERVILVASREEDPELVLFGDDVAPVLPNCSEDDRPRGFYWTEGNSGLGWAVDCVPTLKAGSTIGIPSPPAIWLPAYDTVVTPTIEDAESFQGLPRGWTAAAKSDDTSHRSRWRLVGNAVPVPVAEWVGSRLVRPSDRIEGKLHRLRGNDPWPNAAFGNAGHRFSVSVSTWPVSLPWRGLAARYGDDGVRLLGRPPLSRRATEGFYDRIKRSTLRTDPRFIPSLGRHLKRQTRLQKSE